MLATAAPLHHEPALDVRSLTEGWQAAATQPGACPGPAGLERLGWLAARVPGTAAGALRDAAREAGDLDAQDWWFRTTFDAPPARGDEQVLLHLGGIATVAEVYLNGELLFTSESMFAAHAVDVGARLAGANVLAIRCRALAPLLEERRRPRARWRTKLVADGELRWFRTMLLGRAPGFAAGPAAVGPWRPVWLERQRHVAVSDLTLRTHIRGGDGVLSVRAPLTALGGAEPTGVTVTLDGPSGRHEAALELRRDGDAVVAAGELRIPSVARWWPHTHGDPALHDVQLLVTCPSQTVSIDAGRAGFRSLAPGRHGGHDVAADGLSLHVNDVAVFARGAVWTPLDLAGLAPDPAQLRAALEAVRDAGMNMLRVPGTSAYEQPAFHDLCDELGILVWQDLMFANLDYPFADDAFRGQVEREAAAVLAGLAGRPSLAVLCGNSEVEQQVAMLGLDPALGRSEFFGTTLPALVAASQADAVYVTSAPSGGDRPFLTDRGVANYYGVGGYRRPLADVRAAGVRFAAECLAFANVPDDEALVALAPAGAAAHHPSWKAGVPRDAGSGWDFDDIRDHYLAQLFDIDPVALRSIDHDRYLELSRAVTGEVMAEVLGEWRRPSSPCGGGLVLWLRDLVPGAGWGVLDHRGEPKVAYHHLRRALSPLAVWTTDEGLNGIAVHVANDRPEPVSARLRIALYRDLEQRVGEAQQRLELAGHDACTFDLETLLGRFVDAAAAYRFGPPAQDLIVVTIERDGDGDGPSLLAQSFRLPSGRPASAEPLDRIGVAASARALAGGTVALSVFSRRFAYGVRVDVPGFAPTDDAFSIEPGATHRVLLRPRRPGAPLTSGTLTALNVQGRVRVEIERDAPA